MTASGFPERAYGNEYKTIKKTVTGIAAITWVMRHRKVNPVQYKNNFKNFFISDLTSKTGFRSKFQSGTIDPFYL